MKNAVELQQVLVAIIQLLNGAGEKDWARALNTLRNQLTIAQSDAETQLLSLFGGMGSFNDLVLHRDGIPLTSENRELVQLRSKLFDLCH